MLPQPRMSADQNRDQPGWTRGPAAIGIIAAVAIATRLVTLGNPLVDMDDQFYWLVGQSWWDGQWPITDIWDRKPVGLFLLFGAIAGIDRSILAVQIAALLFAAGTAILVRHAALQIASPRSALLAAATYLLFLPLLGGQSGQSPVFYNLFIAGAGVLLLKSASIGETGTIGRHALAAMALSGSALVIKQVSLAEGIYFGLAYLLLLHRAGMQAGKLIQFGAIMIATALLPTLVGAALYLLQGEAAFVAYLQAGYWSIFTKTPGAGHSLLNGLFYLFIFGGALFVAAAIGVAARPASAQQRLAHGLILGWMAAAVVGYLLVPNFFPHYALPLLVPLSVLAGRAFDRPIGGLLFLALLGSSVLSGRLTDLSGNRRAVAEYAGMVRTVDRARQGGCLYVANGPAGLYASAPDCGVTPYLFPYHLTLAAEATAVGVDQAEEISRIFAARPAVVVTQDDKKSKQSNSVRTAITRGLAGKYRLVSIIPEDSTEEIRTVRIWQRSDLAPPRS